MIRPISQRDRDKLSADIAVLESLSAEQLRGAGRLFTLNLLTVRKHYEGRKLHEEGSDQSPQRLEA
jgi:hypothetical protein